MPNAIKLKYQPSLQEIKTEEQLLAVFSELKTIFEGFKNFEVTNGSNTPVTILYRFLEIAISKKPTVTLKGSGNLGGLEIKNGRIEYDLSDLANLTEYWDINRDDSWCGISCEHFYREYYTENESNPKCKKNHEVGHPKSCADYSPFIHNAQGKPARSLSELISAACA